MAVIDSSVIPMPIPGSTDLFLLLLVSHKGDPWLLAITAIAGSIAGGYTAWYTGRKGGEAALSRYIQPRLLAPVSNWVERHSILSVFVPALLPPPFPLSPFLIASGALGVSRVRFLQVFTVARTIRYSLIAWLGFAHGRGVVRLWSGQLQKWSPLILWIFAAMMLASICFGIASAAQSTTRRTRTA